MKKLTIILLFALTLVAQGDEFRGLLIGISEYQSSRSWGTIHGEEDVQALVPALTERFGVKGGNLRQLLGPEATKENIVQELDELVGRTKSGDTVLIYYTGHGYIVPDGPDGDEEDGVDECIVPYDGLSHRSKKFAESVVTDDVFRDTLMELRARVGDKGQILLIFDSCHSGTMNRAAELSGLSTRTTPQTIISEDASMPEQLPDRVAVLSACQADEVAMDDQRTGGGVFTLALLRCIRDPLLKPDADYRALITRLRKNGEFLDQNPRFEGEWDLPAFGGRILSLPSEAKLLTSEGKLDKGELFGFYRGSRVSLGNIEGLIVEATPWDSRVQFKGPVGADLVGQSVELVAQSSGAEGFRIFADKVSLPEGFISVSDAREADLILTSENSKEIQIWDTSGKKFSAESEDLELWLQRLTKRYYLQRLVQGPDNIEIILSPGRYLRPDAPEGPSDFQKASARYGSDGVLVVRPDQQVEVMVVNRSDNPRHIQLLNFLGDGSVLPLPGSQRFLEPGERAPIGLQFEPTEIFDEGVKVVASEHELDLDGIGTRGQETPLGKFLTQSIHRGEAPNADSLSDPGSYSISETVFIRCRD